MTQPIQRLATAAALTAGGALWITVGGARVGPAASIVLAVAVWAMWFFPASRRRIAAAIDRARNPSPRDRRITMTIVFIVSVAYLGYTAFAQGRWFAPRFHDEHMYVIQMRMLAQGRLWMPPHPVAESFETFHILHDPVYAPISFPGTALAYVPAIWLRLPLWLLPLCVTAFSIAMLYRVMTELIDGAAGLAAVVLALASSILRYMSIIVMSHTLLLLLGLLLIWAWLCWRQSRSIWWAILIGVLGGWAAITRPIEAICWALPIGVAIVVDLWRSHERPSKWAITIGAIILGALPLLAVQAWFNIGVTGSLTRSPYQMYFARYLPQSSIGFRPYDPAIRPDSKLLQRLVYYETFDVAFIEQHQPQYILLDWRIDRLPKILDSALPHRLLWVLLPVGLIGLTGLTRRTLFAVLLLFVAFYVFFTYLLPHYTVPVLPAVMLPVLLAPRVLQQTFPRVQIETPLLLIIAALALGAFPPINRDAKDDPQPLRTMAFDRTLPGLLEQPALVLYKYHRNLNPHEEPVYNTDVAYPDEAPIIRAHDLGPEQNLKLLRHYGERDPQRHVYFIDRETLKILPMGRAGELWERFNKRPATTTTTRAVP